MQKKRKLLLTFLLCVCFLAAGCGTAADETGSPTQDLTILNDWAPAMEIEQYSPFGATIVLEAGIPPEDALVLCGNDYFLEIYAENEWQPLPMLEEKVTWIKDAFVVTAAPRDDIDWQWLYGALPDGHYRIGKSVTLHLNGENIETTTVYGEFLLENSHA